MKLQWISLTVKMALYVICSLQDVILFFVVVAVNKIIYSFTQTENKLHTFIFRIVMKELMKLKMIGMM